MADNNTPFSVRLEHEDKEKLISLIEESGKSNKEFMGVLINAYELNKTKLEIPDIAKDIEGLQALTQRINEYYVNIGKRIEDIRKVKDLEFTKEIEIYKSRVESLKNENEKISTDYEMLQQSYNNISLNCEDIKKQLEQIQENLKDKTLLVEEYKEKNDTLAGLLNEYKQYKTEVEEYKRLLADSQNRNIELNNSIKEKDAIIEKLNNEVEAINQDKETKIYELNTKHDEVIKAVKEKSELQNDKCMLELKTQHQQELQELQNKHNKEIEEYQNKYKQLLEELQKSKRVPATTHKKSIQNDIKKDNSK